MTEQYLPSTDATVTTVEEDTETTISSKESPDEQSVTTIVDENGYESECSSSTRSEEDVARSVLEVEADAFTRFIERQRLDVMFELQRLRLGERPVTGQPNRERIETFLNHIQENQQETRTPSTRIATPSAHIADINTLTNLRCVSGALGSTAFRQDLENTIRHTIGTRSVQPASRVSPAPVVVQQTHPQTTPIPPPIRIEASPMNVDQQERELQAWQAITELQRERIVIEISDLVHRQLVTSALENDFRRHLELNILNRLARGPPVQQDSVATVPRPTPPQPLQTIRPNIEISATNITELTSRLDSMQQMLQSMFTIQMDMQRSLRQEVAGALAQNPSTIHHHTPQPVHAGHCTVCLTAIADTVLYRCGHLCVCYVCGLQLQQSTSVYGIKCPICRAPVEDILRVYRSSRDGE